MWDQRWCVVVVMCHEEFVNYANLINISGCGYNHICIIWISALTIQIQNMCGQAHSQIYGIESSKSHEKNFSSYIPDSSLYLFQSWFDPIFWSEDDILKPYQMWLCSPGVCRKAEFFATCHYLTFTTTIYLTNLLEAKGW